MLWVLIRSVSSLHRCNLSEFDIALYKILETSDVRLLCCLKEVDNACENKILYFPLSFLNAKGFRFITKYVFCSKFKFKQNLLLFHVYEILPLTTKTVMTYCIFKTATQFYTVPYNTYN